MIGNLIEKLNLTEQEVLSIVNEWNTRYTRGMNSDILQDVDGFSLEEICERRFEDIDREWRDLKVGSKVLYLKIHPKRKGITLNKWYEVHKLYKYKDDIDGQRFSFRDDNNKTKNEFKPNPTFTKIRIINNYDIGNNLDSLKNDYSKTQLQFELDEIDEKSKPHVMHLIRL